MLRKKCVLQFLTFICLSLAYVACFASSASTSVANEPLENNSPSHWQAPQVTEAAPKEVILYFDFDSSSLNAADKEKVGQLSFSEYSAYRVEIAGYTDSMGSQAYNSVLAMERSLAVKEALTGIFGNADVRWLINAHGEKNPVRSNQTEWGRSKNRRAEVVIMPIESSKKDIDEFAINNDQ